MSKKLTINYHKMSEEEKKKYHQDYYQEHKEKLKADSRANYFADRENQLQNRKEYHAKNRDRNNERSRIYHHAHKEELNEKQRAYVKANKDKIREHRIKRDYGISSNDYDKMFIKQNGLCAICNLPSNKPLYIDHDHDTNQVRQLLCNKCNLALGYVNDNIDILTNMIAYLEKHKEK